nr:MAG TPA: cellulase [Caudoviricetes sp.]
MKVGNCWANIDKKEGGLNSKVNIYFDENDTGANRSVKIRVSSRDGDVSEEYTLVHKKKEQVVYRNKRQSALFTKEGCNSETERGEELEYVVEAGKYTSIISQSDADNKAMKDIDQNGQNWVNEHGRCITILWYNVKKSKSFRKNDCDPDTEEGSLVTMTIEAGQLSSTISQEDADRKAEAELDANGQDYANSHGTCNTVKWYNDRKSKMFQKTDCEATEVGSTVEYVVEAGRFSSSVSKEDANRKALEALEAEGPGYANEHGTCETNLWYSAEKSKVFYKNGCEDGFIGAPYTYTVEAGKYTSGVSQEDADRKALDDIDKNGQGQANLNGECIEDPNYFVGKASARVQKNDCDAESQTGSFVDLTERDLAGYPDAFVSRESQKAANALAEAAMEEQKQGLANKKGTCIDKDQFVGVYSKVFTKDNCEGEGVGSEVTVDQDDVTGGPFTSYESQNAANALAQAAVEQRGQAIANRDGHCTWTGKYSEEFTKNDCTEDQVGSKITVTERDVVGAPFTSTVSQDDANNKAKAAVKGQGQAIANNKGNCEDMAIYTGHYSKKFVPECEVCHKGVEMEVTAVMVNGSPVTSTESQEAADTEARRIVEEGGQAYANKNSNCTPLSTDPVWEDVEPEELRCSEGKSQKKQRDTNECSETHNQERWVDGGNKVCSWTGHYSETFQKNDCEIPDSGTEVEVSEADVEGNPFTSFVSQEDADNKAKEAVKAQGQNIANQRGKCRFVGVYSKEFTKDNCGSCQHGVPMSVTQDMVGGPFYSNESQEEANRLAQEAVEAQGQAYANKNGTCETDNTDPVWEDSEPLETKCEGGKSYKKQVNTNECYGGEHERWVEGGDKVCTWIGTYSKQFTKQCADGGVGSKVIIDQDDVTGGPFTSTVSQEDANSKAQAAVEQQGQALADAQGTCTWTGKASKVFTRNNCGSCQHGSSVTVTQDQVGGPFTSNISQADANKKAQDAVNSQGQAVANKNGDCVADSTTPSWSDTGSTRCSGCTSQKQQRDTNPCSSSYNDTRWVNGGGESCTDWSYYGTGDCVGHTQYNAYRDSCSGSIDRQHSVSCGNCCNCGSYGSWEEVGCGSGSNSNKVKYVRYDDCGNQDVKHELEVGKCGYAPYEFQFHDGRTSKSRSVSGESQNIEEVIISTKSNSYIGYSVKSKPSWCSIDYRDQTSESMKAVVTLSANTTSSSRSGDIVFVQNESGKTVTLSISQARQMLYKFTFDDNTTSDKSLSVQAASNDAQYTIKSTLNGSYHGYSTTSKPSWVTTEYRNQTSDSMVCVIKITANTSTSSSRTGSILLTQNDSGKTLRINVTQAAAEKPLVTISLIGDSSRQQQSATMNKKGCNYSCPSGNAIMAMYMKGDENGKFQFWYAPLIPEGGQSGVNVTYGGETQTVTTSTKNGERLNVPAGSVVTGIYCTSVENGYFALKYRPVYINGEPVSTPSACGGSSDTCNAKSCGCWVRCSFNPFTGMAMEGDENGCVYSFWGKPTASVRL